MAFFILLSWIPNTHLTGGQSLSFLFGKPFNCTARMPPRLDPQPSSGDTGHLVLQDKCLWALGKRYSEGIIAGFLSTGPTTGQRMAWTYPITNPHPDT